MSPRMMEIIINENNSWSHIVLLSAAINPPIDYLSKEIWIESYSSKLKESKWFYTWDIVPLWWKKEKVFRDDCIKLSKYSNVELYTDNKDDINLMKFLNENNSLFYVHILPYKNTKYREKVLELYNIKHEIMG